MTCPNCENVNGVQFCPYYGFRPNLTAVEACARKREGKEPLDYKTLKKKWFKKPKEELKSGEDVIESEA